MVGMRKRPSPTHNSWRSMKRRCTDRNHDSYKYYGAVGIDYDSKWEKFENFLADMGQRPEGATLDRIDNSKNYSPGNCRWATPTEQAINKKVRKNTASRFRGVAKARNKWRAYVSVEGKHFYPGHAETEEEAAWMRDQWAIALHGELVVLNFDYQ